MQKRVGFPVCNRMYANVDWSIHATHIKSMTQKRHQYSNLEVIQIIWAVTFSFYKRKKTSSKKSRNKNIKTPNEFTTSQTWENPIKLAFLIGLCRDSSDYLRTLFQTVKAISASRIGYSVYLIFGTFLVFIACFQQNIMHSSKIHPCTGLSKRRKHGWHHNSVFWEAQ